jgi:ABC-type antimicrobial peptide transport system permease subunit
MIEAGVEVGSILYIRTGNGGEPLALEVVGLAEDAIEDVQSVVFFGDVHVPPDTLQSSFPFATLNAIMVEPQQMDAVLQELSSMIGVFPLDITFLDRVLSRLIDQFSALPLLVGLLSMGAAAVIMGNTVSLATLERRRQIGILKAIGLGSSRVLGIMLIENVLISLLGAVLGIMLSALGVVVMSYVGLGQVIVLPTDARPVAAVLIGLAVFIGSAATILNATVAVRERVLNVLRYE